MSYPDSIYIPKAAGPVQATVRLPGSKSYTNRALPIAALAQGTSTIHGVLDSDDTRYMVDGLQRLGINLDVDWDQRTIVVHGCDGHLPAAEADLFLGNSGTSIRFLAAVAALGNGTFTLDGTTRMRQRPIGPLVDGLRAAGCDIEYLAEDGFPPIRLTASGLRGGTVNMRGDISSQYFSALAMVQPYTAEPLDLVVDGELVSKPYIDMTAATMRAFGVDLVHDGYRRLSVAGSTRYRAAEYHVEPDASAASYFFALAAVTGGRVKVEHLPPTSAQGDLGFVDVLMQMGCEITRRLDSVIVTGPAQLRGIEIDMNAISDTVPTLAAIAPYANSPVTIRNVEHVRVKESDRIAVVATELRKLGITVDEFADGLTIHPGQPSAGAVETYDDHRIAMSFANLGTQTEGISILDPGCVAKTVPEFWDLLLPLLG